MSDHNAEEETCPFCRTKVDASATICPGCGAYKAIDPYIQPLTLWLQSYALFGVALLAWVATVAGIVSDRYPDPRYGLPCHGSCCCLGLAAAAMGLQ